MIQIALLTGVLITTQDAECDQPLAIFLGVSVAQQCVACVLHCVKKRDVPPEAQPRWVQSIESFMGMMMLSWFLCGNVWTFSVQSCDPTLYTASLALIGFIYVCLTLPLILILLVIFCLPVIALLLPLVIRYFPEVDGREKAATDAQISALELKRYAVGDYAEEDANCCICLEDYQEGSELRVLPCAHHYHR
eukprot:CAMPEP_0173394156 /NCGR_PEP_ID=MMETSP1356-20130122/25546_1 /TAXON_ID=77927 ORGANISM="Hemiselmis virescens, Strain PCC157" /NCGR_SAMPLE_ID=MMETSP1356 /ASSEMBLY_ACC=CAM_ASM_000847 /LENGTH=191 /DNA_ID=CAMNT_0014352385 /DNA_START=98 /DNA_END=669 /DNA_ORIENTATION=+